MITVHGLQFLAYLRAHQVMPDVFAVGNHTAKPPADYPNRVGHENLPNTALGVARRLQLEAENRHSLVR